MSDIAGARKQIDLAYGLLGDARKRLVDAAKALEASPTPEPTPPPVPPPAPPPPAPLPKPVFFAGRGAILVNAAHADPDLLQRAGVNLVAVELTPANVADAGSHSRWPRGTFNVGGFYVSRGGTDDQCRAEARAAAQQCRDHGFGFLMVDTESHKTDSGGARSWTDATFDELRKQLGDSFSLVNITFGRHQDKNVVNHDALLRHRVAPVWEAYDSAGETMAGEVAHVAEKVNGQGWKPAWICVGDKGIPVGVPELRQVIAGGLAKDWWVWAPEQSGATVVELSKAS